MCEPMPESLSHLDLVLLVAVACSAAVGFVASAGVWCIRALFRGRMPRNPWTKDPDWVEPSFESARFKHRIEELRGGDRSRFADLNADELHRREHVSDARAMIRQRPYFEHVNHEVSEPGEERGRAAA